MKLFRIRATIIFFMTFCFLIAATTPSHAVDPVYFHNSELEAAVRDTLNSDGGKLFPSDLQRVRSLELSGFNISDLYGLEYCTGLTNLDLSNNRLTEITQIHSL